MSETDPTEWADEYRAELLTVLAEAGASSELRTVANETDVNCRHSVCEELHKWADGEIPTGESVEKANRLGGGFFTTLWDGDLFDAFCQADSNNRTILAKAFSAEEIVQSSDKYALEYRQNLVEERWPEEIPRW